jgi:hypothetical protein
MELSNGEKEEKTRWRQVSNEAKVVLLPASFSFFDAGSLLEHSNICAIKHSNNSAR